MNKTIKSLICFLTLFSKQKMIGKSAIRENGKNKKREKGDEKSEKEKHEDRSIKRKLNQTQKLQPKAKGSQTVFESISYNLDFIKYPVITEKTYLALQKKNQYTFDVDKRLTKTQIKTLFSSLFHVDVISVNIHIPPRQRIRVGTAQGYRPSFKRALITLKKDQFLNYNL